MVVMVDGLHGLQQLQSLPKRNQIKTVVIVRSARNSIPMLSQTKMTEPLSATSAESVGSIFADIEREVEEAANKFGVEIILLLIDKWENDMQRAVLLNTVDTDMLLGHYVRMKISLHHLKRKMERDWFSNDTLAKTIEERVRNLGYKTKEARRNYYVAKRRFEEHRDDCSCRGCRCVGSFSG
jgi:hypothetical protein